LADSRWQILVKFKDNKLKKITRNLLTQYLSSLRGALGWGFFLFAQLIFAQSGFEAGNIAYKTGDYKTAIYEYESVIDARKHSADLYFNLGNCYFKLNKVAPAIYNYEKALVINPDYYQAENNIQVAQKLLVDDIKIIKKVGFALWLQKGTSAYHYNTWAWIAVYLGGLFLLFFCVYYFVDKTIIKRLFFIAMIVVLIMILISLFCAVFEKNRDQSERPAIVFAAISPLKKAPKTISKDIIILHEGTKVFVLEAKENYKKVQLTDGQIGWILSENIKEVKTK
jgi:tetratricopeptide (TPR) repeat protein